MSSHFAQASVTAPLHQRTVSRLAIVCSVIGFMIFLAFQVIAPIASGSEEALAKPLTKQEALNLAYKVYADEAFASGRQSYKPVETAVIYETNQLLSGYVSKEQLNESYEPWDKLAPYDYYRVLMRRGYLNDLEYTIVDLHMTSGKLVGYQTRTTDMPSSSSNLSEADKAARTDEAVRELGYTDAQVRRMPVSATNPNEIRYLVPAAKVGDASLELVATWSGDYITSLRPVWNVPIAYASEMVHQQDSAEKMLNYAYQLMSLIMGIAAVVCAVIYRHTIHFGSRTIILLAVISCGLSIVHSWNALPSYVMLEQKVPVTTGDIKNALYLQSAMVVVQGGITLYLALVTGRALWRRSLKTNLLPTWRHPDFGSAIVNAFWNGLCWAGILLGMQTIIFTLLELGVDAWSSTDSSSSPLNLTYMYMYPLLAWVAAISEEGFYRLFGVGLLRRWIPNTWVAAIIPTFVWAAGHVMYPIYPFYSRPIELMIIGFVFVWIMVRYGFWTAVSAHLMLDTLLMVMSLFLERSIPGITFGIIYLLLPATVAYGLAALHSNRKTAKYSVP
ncbi:CPBP family intramembrane glutamic endopeptidase [Paenibacillus marinisediminis]